MKRISFDIVRMNVVCAIYPVALFTQLQCKLYTVFEISKFEVRVKELTILEFVS